MATFRRAWFLTQPREDDERTFIHQAMNCPGHIQISRWAESYRDLPFQLAEFRQGASLRAVGCAARAAGVRAFTQDDAHFFITEEQIAEESLKVNNQIRRSTRISAFPT